MYVVWIVGNGVRMLCFK